MSDTKYYGWSISSQSWTSRATGDRYIEWWALPPKRPYNARGIDKRCMISGASRADVKRKIKSHYRRWRW